ncbi:hypothetical protein GS518_06290 [Leptospira interrogans]|uniref:hypothetical protein n=1 Tax=Leptospira interrogans TaxID=173 RepID=UPI0002982CA9|nr:hypothetical protein [Leptospira interrogans]EKP20597.1 hypothetical protein LEP1GSC117_2570 [Leptospira interrogans serovar Icterohaemorrhagiae str. Verdun LP]EKP85669.1 hypothetical protein LEP1GSC020_1374 [Leptospira interrogans serovar Grippotyphosa str. 2006006986]EMO34652.1 hypothetical protein LEP1GSC177_0293 [Leptospira interrogans str. MMD3731]MTY94642.1 hypothetical protein [Leptospira interrogans serovar Copenhageni]QHH27964.1 hypothetical protein GS520_06310 [Leptospira interrog
MKNLSSVNIKENLDDGSLKELTVGTIGFRTILICWERKSENYLASLYLASSIIAFNFF